MFGPALSVLWPPCARGLQSTCTIHFLSKMGEGHLSSIYTPHGTESDEKLIFLFGFNHTRHMAMAAAAWSSYMGPVSLYTERHNKSGCNAPGDVVSTLP